MSLLGVLGVLLGHARPYRRLVVALLIGLVIDAAYFQIKALSFKFLIDRAIVPKRASVLVLIMLILVLALLIAAVAGVWRDRLFANLSARIQNDIRLATFRQLQVLGMDYHSSTSGGGIVGKFSTDIASVDQAIVSSLPKLAVCSLTILFSTCFLFALDWRLALLSVVTLPVCLLGPRRFNARADEASYALRAEEARLLGAVQENAQTQPVVKAFGLADANVAAFTGQLHRLLSFNVRFQFLTSLVARTPFVGVMAVQLLVLGVGADLAIGGSLSVGSLVALNSLLVLVTSSVSEMTMSLPPLLQSAGGLRRIDELMAERPTVVDHDGATAAPPLSSDLGFQDVEFAYATGQRALDRISFKIPAHGSAAFVGPSGSGKSTVLNLALRFFDPTAGKVTIDGEDIRSFTQASLRDRMGVVFQEPYLLATTVRDNIAAGCPDASDAQIVEAAKAAEIHDVIVGLPDGYSTWLGDSGSRLSGGQRQRIAIARALLRNPEVLLLDEPTSALDPMTEAAVNDTLRRISADRTVITVTHRLQAAVDVDEIFVMEKGRVSEQGSHRELLAARGLYRTLWEKQSGLIVSPDGSSARIELDRLKLIPILKDISDALARELVDRFEPECFPSGSTIIEQGDAGDRFYIIARGTVAVTRSHHGGDRQHVAVLQDGDHFGEIALLEGGPRTSTVSSLQPTVVLTLSRESFHEVLAQDPVLMERITELARSRRDALLDEP